MGYSGPSSDLPPPFSPEWERACIARMGFYVHAVVPGPGIPEGLANYHTHGLEESLGHPDLQIVANLGPRCAGRLFGSCVEILRGWGRGPRFRPGEDYHRIIQDMPVRFVEAVETRRAVLRMIVPDADGKILPGEISPPFDAQWRHLIL